MKPIIEVIKETEIFSMLQEHRKKLANIEEFLPGIGDFISEYARNAQNVRKTPIGKLSWDVSEREHKNSSEKLYSNE